MDCSMPDKGPNPTIQKTEWTNSLLQDLIAALRAERDDATVRGFARELVDDKDLPIAYLVHKVGEAIGTAQAERLDLLLRGRHAVDKSKAEKAKSTGGVGGFIRKFLR
jgi:hypothetical protein